MTYLNGKKIITVLQKVASKDVYDNVSNPNLLINGDFRVNQRGQTSYINTGATHTYTVDRWRISVGSSYANAVTVTPKTNGGVNLSFNNTLAGGNTPFIQVLENPQYLIGKTLTFTIYVSAINLGSARFRLSNYSTFATGDLKVGLNTITYKVPAGTTQLFCGIIANASTACDCDIEYAKLEIGNISTAFSPRLYAEELSMCMRHYQIRTTDYTFPNNIIDCPIPMYNEYTRGQTTINGVTYNFIDAELY